jgi:hypothetical protein
MDNLANQYAEQNGYVCVPEDGAPEEALPPVVARVHRLGEVRVVAEAEAVG